MRQRLKHSTPRWLALVAIAATALGAYTISPALGGPARLTLKAAKRHFFTKAQANARFYSKEVANARFLPRQAGEYTFAVHPDQWQVGAGGITKTLPPPPNGGFVRFSDNDANNTITLRPPSVPSQFAGKGLRLSAIEVCYELSSATLDRFRVWRSGPVNGDPIPTQITFLDDEEDHLGDECRRFSAPAAQVGAGGVIDVEAEIDFTALGSIDIGRTSVIFIP